MTESIPRDGRKPALDPGQRSRVNRAREILAILDGGGCKAVTARVNGGPLGSSTQGMDEAFTVGVLAHDVRALLDVIDGLTGQAS